MRWIWICSLCVLTHQQCLWRGSSTSISRGSGEDNVRRSRRIWRCRICIFSGSALQLEDALVQSLRMYQIIGYLLFTFIWKWPLVIKWGRPKNYCVILFHNYRLYWFSFSGNNLGVCWICYIIADKSHYLDHPHIVFLWIIYRHNKLGDFLHLNYFVPLYILC